MLEIVSERRLLIVLALVFLSVYPSSGQEPIFSRSKERLYLDVTSNEATLGANLKSDLIASQRLRSRYTFASDPYSANHGILISQTWVKGKDGKWNAGSMSIVFKDYINNTQRENNSSTGYSADEIVDMAMEYFPFTARVVDRTENIVDIDIGSRFGVTAGDRFDVISENKRIGLIQVTSPSGNSAQAKILTGDPAIGSTVIARVYLPQTGISFQYFGDYPVTADISPTFEANTNSKTPSLSTASLWRVDFSRYRYAGWGYAIGVSVMKIGEAFSPLLFYFEGQGGLEVFPELVELYIGGAVSLGAGFKQKYTDQPNSSPGETPPYLAYGFDAFGGVRFLITRSVLLYGDVGYRSVFVGGEIKSKEAVEVKDEWLQYKNIKIAGVVPRVGITVIFGD